MKNTDKEMRIKNKWITAVIVALALFALGGIYQLNRANALSRQLENHYLSSFNDLTDYVNNIDVLLQKITLSEGEKQISSLSSDVFMQSSAAKNCLAGLPIADVNLDNTSKFLSQAGDYCAYLSAKVMEDGEISDEEYEKLTALSDCASDIYGKLEALREKIYNGRITFSETKNITAYANSENGDDITSGFEKMENEFMQYPSLIYDGPFSDHLEKQEAVFLKYKGQITDDAALKKAEKLLGEERGAGLKLSGEGGGVIETYIFNSPQRDDKSSVSAAVTKQGGFILWMLDSRKVMEEKISVEEAQLIGSRFLEEQGFDSMKESYFEKSGNVAIINYAYMQGDTIIYPDLIKVKVALDNGEILGLETKGYLMCHKEREISTNIIPLSQAEQRGRKHLDISKISLAVIPTDGGGEVLCYELKGTTKNRNFLIYINAETGEDEKILMLMESPEGIFTL